MAVDNTAPIAHGLDDQVDVFFDNSPVFKLGPDAHAEGRAAGGVVRQRDAAAQRLGVRAGLSRTAGSQVVEATVGKGKLFLFAPEITFRAQPHGTFKFLFNGIYLCDEVRSGGHIDSSAARGRSRHSGGRSRSGAESRRLS